MGYSLNKFVISTYTPILKSDAVRNPRINCEKAVNSIYLDNVSIYSPVVNILNYQETISELFQEKER